MQKRVSRFQKQTDFRNERTNPVLLDTILDTVSKNTKYTRAQLNEAWNFVLLTMKQGKNDGHETLRIDLFNLVTYSIPMARLREVYLEKEIESKSKKGLSVSKEKAMLSEVIRLRKEYEAKLPLKSASRRWPKLLEFNILGKEMPKPKLVKLEKFERTNELKRLLKKHPSTQLQGDVVEDQIDD